MGYCPDWQRQNMKKTGASGPTTTPSRKDMGSLFHSTPVAQNPSMTKPMRLADGDTEETYKQRGLEASKNDNVGFFERLRMGNIDQPGSEAYNRLGAGRAYADNMDTEYEAMRSATRSPSTAASTPSPAPAAKDDTKYSDYGDSEPSSVTVTPTRAPAPVKAASRPAAKSSVSGPSSRASAPAPDESAAESRRLASKSMRNDQSDAETSRLMSYRPRTTAPATPGARGQDRILRDTRPGEVDPKTLLPKR